jgi:hypothetical protein
MVGPGRTRTSDLFRVKNEVATLKPFPHLAFPCLKGLKKIAKLPSFDGGLMASFSALPYPESVETRPLGREHRWMVSNHL